METLLKMPWKHFLPGHRLQVPVWCENILLSSWPVFSPTPFKSTFIPFYYIHCQRQSEPGTHNILSHLLSLKPTKWLNRPKILNCLPNTCRVHFYVSQEYLDMPQWVKDRGANCHFNVKSSSTSEKAPRGMQLFLPHFELPIQACLRDHTEQVSGWPGLWQSSWQFWALVPSNAEVSDSPVNLTAVPVCKTTDEAVN